MPEEKKEQKTSTPKVAKEKVVEEKDELKKTIKKGFDELSELIKKAKGKYEKADPKTKKNLVAGVAGAAAFLAGALSAHAMKKKNKK